MKHAIQAKLETGFSLVELMVSLAILVPITGAALALFSEGVKQHASEQSSIDVNQEARSGLEMMTAEIAQSGTHGDKSTTTTSAVNSPSATAQAVSVASTAGILPGDWVEVGSGTHWESVKVTAVGSSSISGVFRTTHDSGSPVRLFALPFLTGMISPSGMAANSSATVTTLRFYGDVNGDSTLQYVEYAYDSENNQITRSITPFTQNTKNAALPFIRNVKANSVQFMVNTNNLGVITSANIALTVQNTVKTVSKYQETELASRIVLPSATAGSTLLYELRKYGGIDKLPPTPAIVTTWVNQ
jgi:prepilin-type N-terminal cleavage/methylation domain-containing protein